jgi:dTDP-4-dehydrorhamnose 3,5-epimerase
MDKVTHLACGASVTKLDRIANPKGDVYHAIKASDKSFKGFGEAYFSTILSGVTKGWKSHSIMTLNLIVPVGTIEFHMRSHDGQIYDKVEIGESFYARLTVPPKIWVAFTGIGYPLNLLLNIADIQHDPHESINMPIEHFMLGC